jgi:[ribosomal protein S5]-alanine N-acetyltransferase
MNRGEGDMSTSRYTFGRADPCGIMPSVELMTTRRRLRDFELEDYQAVHAFATDLAVVSYVEWGPNTPMETQAFLREEQVPTSHRVGAMRLCGSCPFRRGEADRVHRASGGQL